jgi:hypothetical protein
VNEPVDSSSSDMRERKRNRRARLDRRKGGNELSSDTLPGRELFLVRLLGIEHDAASGCWSLAHAKAPPSVVVRPPVACC